MEICQIWEGHIFEGEKGEALKAIDRAIVRLQGLKGAGLRDRIIRGCTIKHLRMLKEEGWALAEPAFAKFLSKHSAIRQQEIENQDDALADSPPQVLKPLFDLGVFGKNNGSKGSWVSRVGGQDRGAGQVSVDCREMLDKVQPLLAESMSWTDWSDGKLAKRDYMLYLYADGLFDSIYCGSSNRGCPEILRLIDLEVLNDGLNSLNEDCARSFIEFFDTLVESRIVCSKLPVVMSNPDIKNQKDLEEAVVADVSDYTNTISSMLRDRRRNSPLFNRVVENLFSQADGVPDSETEGKELSAQLVKEIMYENEILRNSEKILNDMVDGRITSGCPELLDLLQMPTFDGQVDRLSMAAVGESYFHHDRGYKISQFSAGITPESSQLEMGKLFALMGKYRLAVAEQSWAAERDITPRDL